MSAVADSALCRRPGKWLRRMELLGPAVAPVECAHLGIGSNAKVKVEGSSRSFTARELTEMNRLPHICDRENIF